MSDLKTLETNFIQIKQFDFSDKKIRSEGRLLYKSPQSIRWEYTAPNPSILQINGDKITSSTGKTGNMKAVTNLISGLTQGSAIFDPATSKVQYFKGPKHFIILMSPKDKKAQRFIRQIEIEINQQSLLVDKMRIIQTNEDFMDLEFGPIKTNVTLDDRLFKLP